MRHSNESRSTSRVLLGSRLKRPANKTKHSPYGVAFICCENLHLVHQQNAVASWKVCEGNTIYSGVILCSVFWNLHVINFCPHATRISERTAPGGQLASWYCGMILHRPYD